MAIADDTTLTFSNGLQPAITLNKGEYVEFATNQPHVVMSSYPFYANQILLSEKSGPIRPETGDPSLFGIASIEQYQSDYVFVTPAGSYSYNFVHVAAPDGSSVTIDDIAQQTVSCSENAAGSVDGVSYCCERFAVGEGPHTIAGDMNFGVTLSGFSDGVSYAYSGGFGQTAMNSGCVTGGPYIVLSCTLPVMVDLQVSPSCLDDSQPSVSLENIDSEVSLSDLNSPDSVATVAGFGTFNVCFKTSCGAVTKKCCTSIRVSQSDECNTLSPTTTAPTSTASPSDTPSSSPTSSDSPTAGPSNRPSMTPKPRECSDLLGFIGFSGFHLAASFERGKATLEWDAAEYVTFVDDSETDFWVRIYFLRCTFHVG